LNKLKPTATPSEWRKYCDGDFTEPAVNGKGTALKNCAGPCVIEMDGIYVSLGLYRDWFAVSKDGINWEKQGKYRPPTLQLKNGTGCVSLAYLAPFIQEGPSCLLCLLARELHTAE